MDQVLGQILRQAVWERLDMLDELASSADNGSLLSVARSELPRLTHGWRALLASHAPDPRGRCPECSGSWRDRAAACSVWRAAHEHLVSADSAPPGAPYWISGTASRPDVASSKIPGSVFSRLRGAWQARQSTSLFRASIPVGAVPAAAVPAGAGAAR
ncbi:MAG: hypothetical protein ACRDS0_15175 [Pseudonocardiaceae bacterium]